MAGRIGEKKSEPGNGPAKGTKRLKTGNKKGNKKFRLERGGHGYGIQPLGNLYLDPTGVNVRDTGLGTLKIIRDEIILDILGLLSARDLCSLASVSRGFYVFAHHDELWRNLALEKLGGDFDFDQCWKRTYQRAAPAEEGAVLHKPLKVRGFYSDHLFQSWLCASLEIKPQWLGRDNIPRRAGLSLQSFIHDFEEPNRPVIVTDAIATWPALRLWDRSYLLKHAGGVPFAAGPVEMGLERFLSYSNGVQEERPLYIFDPRFADKVPQLGADYEVPLYFQEDLFSILGEARPDHRWLIMGPARSGSSWHIDPNSTSAWNAVVRGAKKWILFPPGEVPPGVHPSPDGADVATSVSLTEWFMNFYEQTQKPGAPKPVEGVCRAGEVMFVPRGWWHMVINLEESIAITQNFVSRRNLLEVLEFLSRPNARTLVSGTRDRESLHDKFRAQFKARFPGELEKLQAAAREKAQRKPKVSFWDTVADSKGGAFRFGFGADANGAVGGGGDGATGFKFGFS